MRGSTTRTLDADVACPRPYPLPGVPGRARRARARDTQHSEFPYNPARCDTMAKKERNDFLDRLVYLALRVVNMAVHSWGIGVASELAKFVGIADVRGRQEAPRPRDGQPPPQLPRHAASAQLRRMARRSMQQLFMLGVEVLFTTRLIRLDTFAATSSSANFREVARPAAASATRA